MNYCMGVIELFVYKLFDQACLLHVYIDIYVYLFPPRLASHICSYKCVQIELSRGYGYAEFHDDLKKLYHYAGVQNTHTTFLFTDTQVNRNYNY